MDNKELSFKNGLMKMNKKFDAKKYWKSFEILAVKVVKIQIKEIVKYEDLKFYEDEVPLTRDHGIDGQLHITLKGNDISITVEAKLRAKGPLGIKEFASSIVNYFINLSDIHFVVTNVQFSEDAQNILKSIQTRPEKNCLNYIDGYLINKTADKIDYTGCDFIQKRQLKKLITYISKESFTEPNFNKGIDQKITIQKKIEENLYVLPNHVHVENELSDLLKQDHCFLIVEGDKGIGKSYIIKRALNKYSEKTSVIAIDLSSDWSQQTLLLEFTKVLLQLDFFKLLSLLSKDDKTELNHQISEDMIQSDDYLLALKQLLFFDAAERTHYNYLVRTFFTNILEKTNLSITLYLYNCSEISAQVSSFFLNFLPAIATKVRTVIEIDKMPFAQSDEGSQFVDSLYQSLPVITTAQIYSMNECSKAEAIEYIKESLQVSNSPYIIDYIYRRYGCNLEVLTEVVDFINQNGLKTQTEIAKMPLIQYGTFSKYLLEQYYHLITESQKRAITWIVVTIELLDTDINYKLLKNLEQKLKIDDSMLEFLFAMPFFEQTDNGIGMKSIHYKKILLSTVPNIKKCDVAEFLLSYKDCWNLSEIQTEYKACCFNLMLGNPMDILEIKGLLTKLSSQNLPMLKSELLLLSYLYCDKHEPESLNTLGFLVDYLESISEKLLYCNGEIAKLLTKADEICHKKIKTIKNSDGIDTVYGLQIKIYFLYYNQQKTLFRFDLAEKYVDKALLLESYCKDLELIGKMYWCKGLCLKEKGEKPGFLDFMLKGIHKYPHAMYLKISYLANYASSNFKRDLNKAYKALNVGIKLAKEEQFVDLEIWLSNDQILCDLIQKNFSAECFRKIIMIREKADRYALLSDISRTYNNEAVWRYGNNNINEALECLQHALSIFDETVTDQQKFLFRTNKIVLLLKEKQDICNDLSILDDWLEDNYSIIKNKLNRTHNMQKENNYAAILSLYKAACVARQEWFAQKLVDWFGYAAFETIKSNPVNAFTQENSLIDEAFIIKDEIFILF